jgi:hypothetical protein
MGTRASRKQRELAREFVAQAIGTQAEFGRIPFADGTLVATPGAQSGPDSIAFGRLGRPCHGLVRRVRRRGSGENCRNRR